MWFWSLYFIIGYLERYSRDIIVGRDMKSCDWVNKKVVVVLYYLEGKRWDYRVLKDVIIISKIVLY